MSPITTTLSDMYTTLTTAIVPGPASASYLIPQLLLPLGLLIPPSTLSHAQLRALVVPASLAATLHAWRAMHGTDVLSMDCLYMTLFHYVFRDPRRAFRRVVRGHRRRELRTSDDDDDDDDVNDQVVELQTYPAALAARIVWVLNLVTNRPLNDWVIGSPTHDRRVLSWRAPRVSRVEFARGILARLVPALFVFMPLSYHVAEHNAYFHSAFASASDPSLSSASHSPLPFLLRPLTILTYTYALLLALFLPPLLLPLVPNYVFALPPDAYTPHTMHAHFGPLAAVLDRGLAGFWGAFWHQQMRHIVSEPGRALASYAGLSTTARPRYALLVVSAFVLSGVTHMGLVPRAPGGREERAAPLRVRVALFFWVQPLGMAVESGVVEGMLRRVPSVLVRRAVRVGWVVAWLGAASLFLVGPFEELGYWGVGRVWVGLLKRCGLDYWG